MHTRSWNQQLSKDLITKVAEATMGFSGSDIQALCTEAVMCCLKRSHPAVNTTLDPRKIRNINPETLNVTIHFGVKFESFNFVSVHIRWRNVILWKPARILFHGARRQT